MTPTTARDYFRGDTALSILGGYLAFTGMLMAALLVMKFVVAIQSLRNVLPAAW
jgi:hypothetical protein